MRRTELKRSTPMTRTPIKATGKKKRRVKTPNTKAKERATELHSLYVRARDGACVRCGETSGLQCAHIIPRRCAYTRTFEGNAAALCPGCHLRLTEWPHEHVAFFTAYLGSWDAYQTLIDKAAEGL